ncbi:MAG: DUF4179 domain-containing protein [Lysinibacillus sp.]
MNKDKLNPPNENVDVPLQKLMLREKVAMTAAKKKRKVKNRVVKPLLVACGLCVTLLSTGFLSPAMATALSNVPLIGPIYADFGEIAAKEIEQNNWMTPIEKQDTQAGLTMTVKEAVYDGNRLLVTVAYSGVKGVSLDEESVGSRYLTINGKPIDVATGSTSQDDIDDYTIIEHHQFTLAETEIYGDKIEVAIHGEDLFGYKGNWNVDFPLEKLKDETNNFYPNVSAKTEDGLYELTVKQVSFTPLSTRIDVMVDYPRELDENDRWPWFTTKIFDDTGNVYERGLKLQEGAMPGEFGHHMILIMPPMEKIPQSFTLKPGRDDNEGGYWEAIEELEMVVPLKR